MSVSNIPGLDLLCRQREELVIDLYLRKGPFWNSIEALRDKWQIASTRQVPPRMATLQHMLRSHPGIDPWEDHGDPFAAIPNDDDNVELTSEWYNDRQKLLSESVPHGLRRYRSYRHHFWEAFTGACLLYDPPAKYLVLFALSAPISAQQEVAPPIVSLHHPLDVHRATVAYYEALLDEIGTLLRPYLRPHGLNLDFFRTVAIRENPELMEIQRKYLDAAHMTDYIAVRADTNQNEVKEAYNLIASTRPDGPKRGRPQVSKLEAVQLAVWHDQFKITQKELAEACNLPLSRGVEVGDDGYVQRSGTIQYHIKIGRKILEQK